jgi:uncharacterized protein (TIRG00374 family)
MATVAVLIFLSVTLLTATSDLTVASYILIMAFVMAFGVAAIVFAMKRFGTRAARFLPARFEAAYHRFHQGTMGGFRERLPLMLTLGLAAWLLEMARLYFVAQALGVELGIALIPVVALGHAILSTVPTPGGVGVVEPGVTGLLLLGLGRSDAASVAIVDRSITYVSILFVGGLMFLLRQTARKRSAGDEAVVPT